MTLTDWIVIGVLVLIIAGITVYIVKSKKSGKKCVGCPYSSTCGTNANKGQAPTSSCCACFTVKDKTK
jgi:hypothetical protein